MNSCSKVREAENDDGVRGMIDPQRTLDDSLDWGIVGYHSWLGDVMNVKMN